MGARTDYIRAGGNPNNKNTQALLTQAREAATSEWRLRQEESENARPAWAKSAADFAAKALSWVAISFTIAGLPIGLAVATLGLVFAEIVAVHEGFGIITTPYLAIVYSVVTVFAYVALLFVRESMMEKESITRVLRALLMTIVLFGLLGRLALPLQMLEDEVWHVALLDIVRLSNLQTLVGFVGAPVATYALLVGTEFSVRYIYARYMGVTGGESNSFLVTESLGERLARAENEFWLTQLEMLKARQERLQP